MSLTFDEARHFLSRTAFGGTPEEIRRVMPLDRAAAVAQGVEVRFDAGLDPAYPRSLVALDVDSGISSFQQGSCGKKTARQ